MALSQAQRIRQQAARGVPVPEIARQLELRPAEVRRVLARSSKRGAPRKREASATLSLVTTAEVATQIRAAASSRGIAVSAVLDELVRAALPSLRPAQGRRATSSSWRARSGSEGKAPLTTADAPEAVRKLLKSYDPKALQWTDAGHRYEVVLAILTRGGDEAKAWLWSVLSRAEVRELVRRYRGAGCAEPDRAKLRRLLGLSTVDVPVRPYVGLVHDGP